MERYLLQLMSDIREAVALAPVFDKLVTFSHFDEDEPNIEPAAIRTTLPELLGIAAEVFPPSSFLKESHMDMLVREISKLWNAWQLYWDMPPNLSLAQQYDAMRRAMLTDESFTWQRNIGGNLTICQYEAKGFCPFGEEGECYCKAVNEAAKHDLEVWEEHVRSQGIDPYIDLSEETGAAFEAENRKRSLKKLNNDEWPQLDFFETQQEFESRGHSISDADLGGIDNWPNSIIWDIPNINGLDSGQNIENEIEDGFEDFFESDS